MAQPPFCLATQLIKCPSCICCVFELFAFYVKWVDICYFSSSLSLTHFNSFIYLYVQTEYSVLRQKPFRRLFYLLFPFDWNHSNRLPSLKIHLNNCDFFFWSTKHGFCAIFVFSFMNCYLESLCLCSVSFISWLETQQRQPKVEMHSNQFRYLSTRNSYAEMFLFLLLFILFHLFRCYLLK